MDGDFLIGVVGEPSLLEDLDVEEDLDIEVDKDFTCRGGGAAERPGPSVLRLDADALESGCVGLGVVLGSVPLVCEALFW